MKILIAGYGSIGRRHLNNLKALGETDVALYRTHHSTLPGEEIPDCPVFTDLSAALAEKPQGVIIANPTALHLDVAIPAAETGCHLLIEKPIAHNLERIPELKEAIAKGRGQVLVGYQFRFHPGLLKVRHLLADKIIGTPLSLRCEWGEYLPGWHPWEDYRSSYSARTDLGGGVVLTLSHPMDYLRWIFGEVDSLWALSGNISDLELQVEDFAEISLQFASGVVGSLHLNYYRRPPVHRLEITCGEGTVSWDNADGAVKTVNAVTGREEIFSPPAGFERNSLFMDEMRHFLDIVHGKADSSIPLEDGEWALLLSQAILESARLEQKIIFDISQQDARGIR